MREVPFGITITPEERDRDLTKKLKAEYSGILRWAVQGCLAWQEQGMPECEAVRRATAEYRKDTDALGDFLESNCRIGDDLSVGASALFASYTAWAEENNELALSQTKFASELKERGFYNEIVWTTNDVAKRGSKAWRGLELADAEGCRGYAEGCAEG